MEESAKSAPPSPPIEGGVENADEETEEAAADPQRSAKGEKRQNHVRPSGAGRSDVEAEGSKDAKPGRGPH